MNGIDYGVVFYGGNGDVGVFILILESLTSDGPTRRDPTFFQFMTCFPALYWLGLEILDAYSKGWMRGEVVAQVNILGCSAQFG